MGSYLAFVAAFALLCTVRGAEEKEDDPGYQKYLSLCEEAYPEAEEMDVFYYEKYQCFYYCYGTDKNDSYIGDVYTKEEGSECTSYYFPEEEYKCLQGICSRSSDIETCSGAVQDLTSMVDNDCSLTCNGDSEKTVKKAEGNACSPKGRPYKAGTCTGEGMCKEEWTRVSDPSGGSTASESMAQAVSENRHPDSEYVYVYPTNSEDYCEFVTYWNEEETWNMEILTTQDGYTCKDENGWKCVGGRCTSPAEVRQCAGMNDGLKRVDYDECQMMCKGAHVQTEVPLPVNSTCTKMLYGGWYQQTGTCDESGECIVNEDYYNYEERK